MSKIMRADESAGDGNTKSSPGRKPQPIAVTRYCFTYNNYPESAIHELQDCFREICDKFVFQQEMGENGTPHLQGAIWLKKRMRYSQFGLPETIHWEKMRNEEASLNYCTKSETAVGEPISYGFPRPVVTITDLYPWQQSIVDLYFTEPDGRTCNWFWENTGGVGKSSFCKYMFVKHKAITIQGGKLSDIMNIVFNLDMDTTRMLIIDVPRNNGNKISYSSVECILNGMITNTKFETGVKVFNPPHIVIFSNFPPEISKLSSDRWRVIEIGKVEE